MLEEGIGADIISDMTQNIIDHHFCEFTIDIMQKLGLESDCQHRARNGVVYDLLVNPFITTKNNKKCPIKLLPNYILEALKNHDFSHYDIEKDWKGLHRWLKDGEKFIKFKTSNKVGFLNDYLEEIFLAVSEIVDHFKYSIEKEGLWRMFWTPQYSELAHVKEFYSQMLFYTVANSWIMSKDNNLNMVRLINKETKLIDFRFYVSGKYAVKVQVKHSENYKGLKKGYEKTIEQKINRSKEKDFYLVMNFDEEQNKQLKVIKKSEEEGFKIIEIDVDNQENKQVDIFDIEPVEFELTKMFTEYESLPKSKDKYLAEKSKGGSSSYKKYKPLRDKVFELCESELKKKKYSSAEQLCKKVAKIIEDQHLSLLDNFEPYQLVVKDGGNWLKPTFYGWCNELYKRQV